MCLCLGHLWRLVFYLELEMELEMRYYSSPCLNGPSEMNDLCCILVLYNIARCLVHLCCRYKKTKVMINIYIRISIYVHILMQPYSYPIFIIHSCKKNASECR